MKLIFTNIEGGTFTHMSTYRMNHINSFFLSCRKTSPPPRRQVIIYTALFQMKYRISFGSQNTGEEAALERFCLRVQEKKNWDAADTSAGAVHEYVILSASTNPDD